MSGYQPTLTPDYGQNRRANTASPFAVNVNRNKTRRWVNAKAASYDGDDWGSSSEEDEEDDHRNGNETPGVKNHSQASSPTRPAYPSVPRHVYPYSASNRTSFVRSAETLGRREDQSPSQSAFKPFPGSRPSSTFGSPAAPLSRPVSQTIPAIDTSNQPPVPASRFTESPKKIGFPTKPQDELHLPTAHSSQPSNKRQSMSTKAESPGAVYPNMGSRPLPLRQTFSNQLQSPGSYSTTSLDDTEHMKQLESRPSLGNQSTLHEPSDVAPSSGAQGSVPGVEGSSNTASSPIRPMSSIVNPLPAPVLKPSNAGDTSVAFKARQRMSMQLPTPVAEPQKNPDITMPPRQMTSSPVDLMNTSNSPSSTSVPNYRPARALHKEDEPGQLPPFAAGARAGSMPPLAKLNGESGSSTPDDSAQRTHEHLESEIMMSLDSGRPVSQIDFPVNDGRFRAATTPTGLPPAQRSRHSFHPGQTVKPQTAPLDVASKHKSFSLYDTLSERAQAIKAALPRPPNRRKFSWEEDSEDETAVPSQPEPEPAPAAAAARDPTPPADPSGGRPTISLVTDLNPRQPVGQVSPAKPSSAATRASTSFASPPSAQTVARDGKMQMTFDDILGADNSRLQHSPSSSSATSHDANRRTSRLGVSPSPPPKPAEPEPVPVPEPEPDMSSPDEQPHTHEEQKKQQQQQQQQEYQQRQQSSPVHDDVPSAPPSPAKSDPPVEQAAPAISVARASEDNANRRMIVRNVERQLPDFRTVMAIDSHTEKLRFLNRARDEAYSTKTGLGSWVAYMLETYPEHSDVLDKELAMESVSSEASAALSPAHAKHTNAARTLSRLTALASSTHGHSGRPSFLTSTQVQSRGKDFLQSAGGAAKGLFAKGRSRWRGGSGGEE